MDERIHNIDPAKGESVGVYAIDPTGNLITLGRTQTIKAGFRYATAADIAAKSRLATKVADPAPIVVEPAKPEPINEVVHELSFDTSDRD